MTLERKLNIVKIEPMDSPLPKSPAKARTRTQSRDRATSGRPDAERQATAIHDGTSDTAPRPYHHGALREALIDAAESVLAEKGVDGFALRECARRAGVSPAAPAHHFGDAAGLLAEVATRGFQGLGDALRAGNLRGGNDPVRRLHEQGLAYVSFAAANPGAFKLMFSKHKLGCGNERLSTVARAAFMELENGVRDVTGKDRVSPRDEDTFANALAAWSLVHGFAHLAIDGEFDHFPDAGSRAELFARILPQVLKMLPGMK